MTPTLLSDEEWTAAVEAAKRAIYDLEPARDQETDIDGYPLGKPYIISYDDMVESYPATNEAVTEQAEAALTAALPIIERALTQRIADAQAEIAASLLFHTPRDGKEAPNLAYSRDRLLASLVAISQGLANGFEPHPKCEACGLRIEPGARYVYGSEDGLFFHCECAEVDAAECEAFETREEQAADLRKQIARTTAYLDAGGCFAALASEERK